MYPRPALVPLAPSAVPAGMVSLLAEVEGTAPALDSSPQQHAAGSPDAIAAGLSTPAAVAVPVCTAASGGGGGSGGSGGGTTTTVAAAARATAEVAWHAGAATATTAAPVTAATATAATAAPGGIPTPLPVDAVLAALFDVEDDKDDDPVLHVWSGHTPSAAAAADAAAAAAAALPFAIAAAAIRSGRLARIAALTPAQVVARGAGGWTPLMVAVVAGDADAVAALLAVAGACGPGQSVADYVSAVNDDCNTALHLALYHTPGPSVLHLVRAIMACGADTTLRNARGDTPAGTVQRRYAGAARRPLATTILKTLLLLDDGEPLPVCAMCYDADVNLRLPMCGHCFCETCLVGHITGVVTAGGVYDDIKCPGGGDGCATCVAVPDVVRLLTRAPHVATVLETRARDRAVAAMQGFEWCVRCPAGAVYVDDAAADGVVGGEVAFGGAGGADGVGGTGGAAAVAPACTTRACAACPAVWCRLCRGEHTAAVSCEAHRAIGEAASVTWIAVHTKPCPRCGVRGVRDRGCSHILCRCGANYCYMCLGPYIVGVYTHEMGGTCGCAASRERLWAAVVARRSEAAAAAAGTPHASAAATALARAIADATAAGMVLLEGPGATYSVAKL